MAAVQMARWRCAEIPLIVIHKTLDFLNRKVLGCVHDFFHWIVAVIYSCCTKDLPPPVLDFPPIPSMPVPTDEPPTIIPAEELPQVDLNPFRETLSQGIEDPPFSLQDLTARDLIQLIDEFPGQKQILTRWAIQWASGRVIAQDPTHPYSAIFEDLERYRPFITFDQRQAFYLEADANFDSQDNVPPYFRLGIIFLGLQELSRPAIRELMKRLDDGSCWRRGVEDIHENYPMGNPAHAFAAAISKMDVLSFIEPAKLHQAIDLVWECYQRSKQTGNLFNFFAVLDKENRQLGYGKRILNMEEFLAFLPYEYQLNPEKMTDERTTVFEYFRVFLVQQMKKFAEVNHWDLNNWKVQLHFDPNLKEIFEKENYTLNQFRSFLWRARFQGNPMSIRGKPIPESIWMPILQRQYGPKYLR